MFFLANNFFSINITSFNFLFDYFDIFFFVVVYSCIGDFNRLFFALLLFYKYMYTCIYIFFF